MLNTQERMVLFVLVGILGAGAVLEYTVKRWPPAVHALAYLEDRRYEHKLDLNTATVEDLVALPRIGPVTARAIVDYRRQAGPFTTIDELQAVPGIGPRISRRLSFLVKISPPGP